MVVIFNKIDRFYRLLNNSSFIFNYFLEIVKLIVCKNNDLLLSQNGIGLW